MHTFYTRLLILLVLLAPLTAYAAGDLAPGGGAIGGLPSPYGSEGDCLLITSGVPAWGACPGAGSGAPADAKYITQTANGTLSAEQALATLATGIMKVTTTTGVVSVAVKGTDYPGLDFANVFTTAQTFQPATDVITGTFRRNGAAQTANIIEIQTEANALLASIDKTGAIVAPSFTGNVTGAVTGNASTATALAANGSNCSAGQFPLGVDASGAVESCTALPTTIAGTSSEITASASTGAVTLSLPSSIDLGSKSLEIPNSTTLPATCTVGQIYMDTDATSGQRLYACQATNTWALQGDGGGGGSSSTGSANAVQTADGAGAFTDSGCTATGGAMTCSGGFTSGTSGVGTVTMLEGTAPGAGGSAGQHNLYFDSTGSLLKSHENGGSVVTYYSTANAPTSVSGNAGTATALAANPADCAANNFATTIAANGDLTCAQPSISAGVSGLGTGVATFLGTPSSANLGSALTDETGSGGGFVRATAPTIDSPVLSTKVNLPRVTALPGTPSSGDTVIITDDSAAGACDSAAGSATSICQYNGSAWVAIGDGNSGSGAPTNATYLTQTANGSLSNEQAIGALATGCMSSTTTTGVVATRTLTGTANQITVTNGDCSGTPTFSIPTNPTLPGTVSATAFTATGAASGIVDINGVTSGKLRLTTADATAQTVTVTAAAQTVGAATLTIPNRAGTNGTFAFTDGNVATATALAADPADCPANNFANAINASGTLTCGQPSISAGVSGLGTGVATFAGTPSSANLRAALTDETGSGGAAVFATAPTIDAPVLTTKVNLPRVTAFPGTPSAGDTVIVTDDSTAGACDSAAGSATSLCQYSGSAWVKLGDGTSAGGALSSTDIDTSAEIRAIVGDETGSGALVFATSPTLTTPTIGVATATSINKMAITAPATSSTLAVANGKTFTSSNTLTLAGTDSTTITFQATDTYVGRATTDTLTNKTLDVEGTGNVFTTVRRVFFPAAGCNNATAGSVWDLPTSNPAVAACKTGTNTQMGVLDFADSANLSAQTTYMLPTTWTGTIDARIKWLTSATTGDVVWQLSTICVADAETDDPAFNTASTVTDTAKGTTLQTNDAAITTVTVTGCAAGELMHLKIQRDSAHASDTLAATARLIGVELAVREAL